MKRNPQLDGLRGIAASLVVVHHWTTWGLQVGLGNIGVQLFFVLSGFLITRILLGSRDRLAAGELGPAEVIGAFHLSRAARIWPVALITLSLVWAAGDRFERHEDMLWHALFASNFLFFERGDFTCSLSHFWSLAVEQQFYLVWPFVVLLVPVRRLEPTILALVIVAPLARLVLAAAGYTHFAQNNVLPIANFDSLGMGALVALLSQGQGAAVEGRWRLLAKAAVFATLALLALRTAAFVTGTDLPANLDQTFYSVAFAWIVAQAAHGIAGPIGRLLSSRLLVALGVISYGVYVYHVFAPRAVGAALRVAGVPQQFHHGAALLALSAGLTLFVATLSWVLIERPILTWRQILSTRRTRASMVERSAG